MFEGLDPKLEDVVGNLNVRDGIVIVHKEGSFADRSMGYVLSSEDRYLVIHSNRNLYKILGFFGAINVDRINYDLFKDIKVVDPIKSI